MPIKPHKTRAWLHVPFSKYELDNSGSGPRVVREITRTIHSLVLSFRVYAIYMYNNSYLHL